MSRKDLVRFIAECNKKGKIDGTSNPPSLEVKKLKDAGKNVTTQIEESGNSLSNPGTRKRGAADLEKIASKAKKTDRFSKFEMPTIIPDETFDRLLLNYTDLPSDVDSLWLTSSPPDGIIDKYLCTDADREIYQKMGSAQCSRAIDMLGLRLVSLARYTESETSLSTVLKMQLEKENVQLKEKVAESLTIVRNSEKVTKELSQVQEKMSKIQVDLDVLKLENAQLSENKSDLSAARDELAIKLSAAHYQVTQLEEKVLEMKMYAAQQLNEGFSVALEQVACLYPDLDLSQVSIFKEVRDGKLVQIGENESAETMSDVVVDKDKAGLGVEEKCKSDQVAREG